LAELEIIIRKLLTRKPLSGPKFVAENFPGRGKF